MLYNYKKAQSSYEQTNTPYTQTPDSDLITLAT